MNYAVEYTPNENEGSQLEYVDFETFDKVASANDPASIVTDPDGDKIVFDEVGAYYA